MSTLTELRAVLDGGLTEEQAALYLAAPALAEALSAIVGRIEHLQAYDRGWSREYLWTVLAEIAEVARAASGP